MTNRIILTGASAGIGHALALEYAGRGAKLLLVARRGDLLEQLARDVEKLGGEAILLVADASTRETALRAVELAQERFGGIDLVVMNAGRGGPMFVDTFDIDEVEKVMEINALGVMRMVAAVLPVMLAAGHGQLVAISSLAAYRGMPGSAVYNASKGAVTIFMESLRTELRTRGIDVTTIAPGFIRTDMTAKNEFTMPFLMEPEEAARRIARAIDARRTEYRFPLSTSLAIRFLEMLPNRIYDSIVSWGRRSMRDEG